MKYPFSQLIREIFEKLQGLREPVYKRTPSERNAAVSKNFLTAGGMVLAKSFVNPPRSAPAQLRRRSSDFIQNHFLQLRKEGIL